MACLDIGGHQYNLSPGCLYLIGRKCAGLGNQKQIIGLDCDSVDKKHAIMSVANNAVHLIDLVSNGGSYVDDLRLILAEQIVTASESVLRFGNITGTLKLNRATEKLHDDSSGFNESDKNTSNVANSSTKLSITSSSDHHSFILPQAGNRESQSRKSDSFNIPDTQFVPVESDVNSAKNNKLFIGAFGVDDDDDDFCIPETQDVLIDTANTRDSDAATMLTAQAKAPPTKLESSQATDLGSGTQLRICTQDFNEIADEDTHCSGSSDDLLSSAVIPLIRHSPVVLNGSANKKLDHADAELSNLNWSSAIFKSNPTRTQAGAMLTPEREAAVTPDLCDLPNATSKEQARLATCTPDLFDISELTNKSAATVADQSRVQGENDLHANSCTPNVSKIKNVTAGSNKSVRNELNKSLQDKEEDSPMDGDEEDFIPTQLFISHEARNISNSPIVSASSTNEPRSCTPDLFDFVAPASVSKLADKSKAPSNSGKQSRKSANVHAKALPVPPPTEPEEDEEDLLPTQVYVPIEEPDNNSTALGGKETHVFSVPQDKFAAEQRAELSNKENRRANIAVAKQQVAAPKAVTATEIEGDEEDFIPTQLFIPSRFNWQLSSTLISSDANVRAKNAASFFEAMETTPPAQLVAPVKTLDEPLVATANSEGSTETQLPTDMFSTPQIIRNNWQQPNSKSMLGIRDETDDETDELGTFDDLVPTRTSRKSDASDVVEAQKQANFKLAFDIQLPPEVERSRADRALKRQVRDMCQKTLEEPAKKIRHKEKPCDAIIKTVENTIESNAKPQPVKEKNALEAKPPETKEKSKPHKSDKEKKLRSTSAPQEERAKAKTAAKEKGKSARKAGKLQASPVNSEKRVLRSKLVAEPAPSSEPSAAAVDLQTRKKAEEQPAEKKTQKIRKPRSKPVAGKQEQVQQNADAVNDLNEVDPPRKQQTRLSARLSSQTKGDSDKVAKDAEATESTDIASANKLCGPRKKTIASREVLDDESLAAVPSPASTIFSGSEVYNSQQTDATDNEEEQMPKIKLKRVRKVPEKVVVSDTVPEPKQVNERRRATRQNSKLHNDKPAAAATGKSNDQQHLAKKSKKSECPTVETSDNKKEHMKLQSCDTNTRRTRAQSAEESRAHGKHASSANSNAKTVSSLSKVPDCTANEERNTSREKQCEPVLTKKDDRLSYATSMVDKERIKSLTPGISPFLKYVSDPTDCDVLIMDAPNRTFKFLVVMARGRPILSTKWLETVRAERSVRRDALEHFFPYSEFQKKYSFNFKRSFQLANSKKILADYQFLATPSIQPTPNEFKVIVECAGGTFHIKMPPSKPNQKLYLISNNTDKKYWHNYRRENANLRIVKEEAVLLLVMRQSLRPLEEYLLD